MKKGVWRTQISWLFLIHYELSENQKYFFGFFTVFWCDLEGAPPHPQAKSGSPALLGLSIQYFWFFVSINKCYLQNIQICIFIFLAHFILWRIWRHFPTIVFGSLILLNLKFYRVCITTHKPNCTKFSGDFQKTWKRKT